MIQFTSNFTNPFYGGSYQLGPVTTFDADHAMLADNPGVLPLDEATTHLKSDACQLQPAGEGHRRIHHEHAGTGQPNPSADRSAHRGDQRSNTGYLVVNDANGNYVSTTPTYGSGSYINPLPSVQFRYTIDQDSDIRAVYGRGISRPDPYQLVPYITVDQSTTPIR